MNIFRLVGDLLHLFSIFLLLWKLKKNKNCIGISCRMQELYLIVFICRYLDLFWSFVSVYNTTMKVIFISSTAYLIFLMRVQPPISQTYDKQADSFPYISYLIAPSIVLSILTTTEYTAPKILWTFSIWLESAAIMPQLVLFQQLREVENLASHYVVVLGLYRAFYILNWVYRFIYEHSINWIGWTGGAIQVALYLDFFYYYAMAKWYGQKLILPFAQDV